MRYYNLAISDPISGQVWKPTKDGRLVKDSTPGYTFSSQFTGPDGRLQNNPGALNIEFDIPVSALHVPQGKAIIRIWGVGLQMLGQSAYLNLQNFALVGGMSQGLPLATAAINQRGLLAQGQIFQAFGNWQGVNQTLELVVFAGGLAPDNGVSFDWQPGTSLQSALNVTLGQAFPSYTPLVNILPLQPPEGAAQPGTYDSLQDLADYLNSVTQPLGAAATGNANYPGVTITVQGGVIAVQDGTAPQNPVQLVFQDLIGQPTWLEPLVISFKTVLRSDIQIGTQVVFPTGLATPYALTSQEAAFPNTPARARSVFQGKFQVTEVHHFANFRQADADSWTTAFSAVPLAPQTIGPPAP